MFVFLAILALLGMKRRWPVIVIALIIGAATATRATGVALVPAFAYHLWRMRAPSPLAGEGRGEGQSITPSPKALRLSTQDSALRTFAIALSCWGILAFTVYQWSAFDEPFAWARAHSHWRLFPDPSLGQKLLSLITLEPVWSMFLPDSPRYWAKWEWHDNPFFSLVLANPILFVFSVAVITIGALNRWLTAPEILLSAGLLLIPYGGRGYENLMLSTARFSAVVVPVYLVLGNVLSQVPNQLGVLLLTANSFFVSFYSAMFARGYQVF
jgi:hypothetical protein